jgi:transposase
MDILGFSTAVRSDSSTWKLLRHFCLGKWQRVRCPACQAGQPYLLREGRYRCRRCRHTFGLLTGRWMAQCRLAPQTWLWLIKLFELEVTALQAARQARVSYPTALRAYTTLRRAILSQAQPELLGPRAVELDESYFGPVRSKRARGGPKGRGTRVKTPVFGVLERGGRVVVQVIPDASARTLLDSTLRLVKRGSIVYSDKWSGYDTLTFCGYKHLRVDHGRRFTQGKVHVNGLEGFWSYAKGKLIRHRGISRQHFPLYLYEMQFRYNHRHENLFPLLLKMVLEPVPKPL